MAEEADEKQVCEVQKKLLKIDDDVNWPMFIVIGAPRNDGCESVGGLEARCQ